MKKRHKKLVSVTYGSSNKQIDFISGMVIQFVRAIMMKWKRGQSTHMYTRNGNAVCACNNDEMDKWKITTQVHKN